MGGYCSQREHHEEIEEPEPIDPTSHIEGIEKYFFCHTYGESNVSGDVLIDMSENRYIIKRPKLGGFHTTVKIYSYETTNDMPKLLAHNEIYFFKNLEHPVVLKLTHIEERGRRIMLYFEDTKRSLIQDMNNHFEKASGSAYDEVDVASIMHQMFSFLKYLHYKNYVHRDIKPENFLISSDESLPNTLRISSLCTIADMSDTEVLKGMVGTYLYMAPEMITGKFYDKAVDIWSAGVIMYMMLTGEHPLIDLKQTYHKGESRKTLIKRALQKENLKLVDANKPEIKLLSKGAKVLLESLLELDPKKRITAERVLKDPWLVSCVSLKRGDYVTKIEQSLRLKKNLHEILMNLISVVCAPAFKLILLDRMCNPCGYARKNGYPEVDKEILKFYKKLFYLIDDNGDGFLSRSELLSFKDQFPTAMLRKGEITEMLANTTIQKDYAIPLKTFEHAAALYTLQTNKERIDKIFTAIDLNKGGTISLAEVYAAHTGGKILTRELERKYASFLKLEPTLNLTKDDLRKYLLDIRQVIRYDPGSC